MLFEKFILNKKSKYAFIFLLYCSSDEFFVNFINFLTADGLFKWIFLRFGYVDSWDVACLAYGDNFICSNANRFLFN